MTTTETVKILSVISEMYPSFRKDRDPEIVAKVWGNIFRNAPYDQVEHALMTFIATDTKGFPPQPGSLISLMAQAARADEPDENEAWALVMKAASRGYYNSREEFDKLPECVRQIVRSPQQIYEWAQLDTHEVQTVIASNFKRAWRDRQASVKEFLPLLSGEQEDRLP